MLENSFQRCFHPWEVLHCREHLSDDPFHPGIKLNRSAHPLPLIHPAMPRLLQQQQHQERNHTNKPTHGKWWLRFSFSSSWEVWTPQTSTVKQDFPLRFIMQNNIMNSVMIKIPINYRHNNEYTIPNHYTVFSLSCGLPEIPTYPTRGHGSHCETILPHEKPVTRVQHV